MSTVLIVILAVLAVAVVLAVGGAILVSRRTREDATEFAASLTSVDRHLAEAVAEDHGWKRETLEAAARAEVTSHRPGTEITGLELTQIVDEPGTDHDLAVFDVATARGPLRLTLGRRDGEWYAAAVEDIRTS